MDEVRIADLQKIRVAAERNRWIVRLALRREVLLLLFIGTFIIIASLSSPYFLNLDNFRQVLIAISLDTVVAVGMTIVLVSGGIDLSVGSIIGFSATIVGQSFGHGLNIPLTIFLALLGGMALGAVNGYLISYVNINPIISTLGMMTIGRSATYILSGGYPLSTIPGAFKAFALGEVLGVPNLALVALICVTVFTFFLSNNVTLRKYYFIGGNIAAAYRAGIKVDSFRFFSYVLSGLFSAIAGILLVSRMGSVFPHSGSGTEIRVISACIIGGSSISGGKGTVLGSFLGVLLLGLISNILVLLNVSVYWQGVASGAILILAVAMDAIINRRRF